MFIQLCIFTKSEISFGVKIIFCCENTKHLHFHCSSSCNPAIGQDMDQSDIYKLESKDSQILVYIPTVAAGKLPQCAGDQY